MTIPDDVKLVYADDHAEWTDGRHRYQARVHYDQDTNLNDYDCYGKTSKYCYDYWRDGRTERPEGFTGRARKIEVDRGYWMWWEPFNECGEWDHATEDERREQINFVTDLLRGGFVGISVERETLCSHGHWFDSGSESLWGIDSLENDYGREVIEQLIEEMGEPDDEIHL